MYKKIAEKELGHSGDMCMGLSQKILIVDDKKANLVALQHTLGEVNAEVIEAMDGDEALRATLNHDFALAILDVNMPDMDGYELAEILHSDQRTKYLPIIFLTAIRMEDTDIFKGYEAGAVDYIVKPYNPLILLGKVRVFLQIHRQRKLLRLQQKQLQAANHELEAFSYSVSHDLRAPLRALNGFSDLLIQDYGEILKGDGQTYLRYVQESAQEMSDLIDDLLRLSRSTRGAIQPGEVNLSLVVKKIFKDLQQQQPDRNVQLSVMEDVIGYADHGLIRGALENLLANAWKFTRDCSDPCIEFGVEKRQGDQPIYFVRDNGAGFNMEYGTKLFTPFERLHRKDEFPGTGIGLATVQRIIHRHGGEIWGEGEPGKGATFFFQLGEEVRSHEIAESFID
ncbi:MAG: response regulator [Thermodesulfobacteriota bacterium]